MVLGHILILVEQGTVTKSAYYDDTATIYLITLRDIRLVHQCGFLQCVMSTYGLAHVFYISITPVVKQAALIFTVIL